MTLVTVSLTNAGALEIACTACGLRDRRTLTAADYTRLRGWQDSYTSAVRAGSKTEVLLAIGRDVHSWLDGSTRVLQSITEAQSPYVFEYRVARAVNEDGEAFLHAPWELLADENGFWAGRIDRLYFPVRRLGAPALGGSKAPSPYALSLLFMAAAPEGADNLEFEAEETAVVRATAGLELDLIVEESGTLELLQVRAAEHSPDVVHISCHGTAKPNPALLLEDEGGAPVRVGASELVVGLGGALPRLLFLSACETAQAGQASGNAVLPSLTVSLLHAGAPAVLGWAAPVPDVEATQFAAELYRRLTLSETLEEAVGRARFRLLNPGGEEQPARHWHLARLIVGPEGGGKLATGASGSRLSQGGANRAFLNRKLSQVPVASSSEFVGRRRKLQQILREMNSPAHAGVLIHGLGRQGKSSLAARVADRLEDRRYAVAVVHGAYSTPDILSAIRDASPGSRAEEWLVRAGRDIETPEQLEPELVGLLEGPCGHYEEEHGRAIRKPLLLIIDDLEQVLEISGGSPQALFTTPDSAGVAAAVIRAFDRACPRSRSRLLFTSRFEFTLQADGVELADRLLSVQLPPMPAAESERQLAARGRTIETKDRAAAVGRIAQRSERIVAAGLGSPGLQELLTGLAVEDEVRCDRCLDEMVRLKAGKRWPEEQVLQDFMQQIVLKQIADALTQKQRELFRASTLFNMPIPEAVLLEIAGRAFITSDPDDVARLIALGAWDVFGESSREFAPAPLLLPLFAPLKHDEVTALAAIAVRPLFMAWGGAEGGSTRPAVQDLELTRLSIFGNDTAVLASCARYAVRLMMNRGDMSAAANLGAAAIDTMDRAGGGPPLELLWAAAESQAFVGDADDAKQNLDRALQNIKVARAGGKPIDPNTHGGVLLEHARLQEQRGELGSALAEFDEACRILPGERERAIARGQIANILQSRGDLDEALRIRREEELPVYERLSDVRSRAVTMGKIADILQSRGDLDEALRIRREEELPVYERLGDVRERAVTMGQIADILQSRGDLDEALRIRREEELPVYERLGDVRSRAVTMGNIADILQSRGDLDEALRIRREEQLPVYERLGDVRERAVTMGQIADILQSRGDLDEALRIRREEELPVYERLGDVRSRAVTMGNIADILQSRGDLDEALRIRREEELPVYERLGDVRSRAVTMGNIADILQSRGDLDEALRIRREEELPVYERLSDVRSRAVTMGKIADILEEQRDLDGAVRIYRDDVLPAYERLGDVRLLMVDRANLAMKLARRGREEDAQEIATLLMQAFQAAERMGLPEAKQIAEIAGNIFGEEMADILLSAEPDSTEPEQEV